MDVEKAKILTQRQLDHLKKMFDSFDKDGNGSIDAAEFHELVTHLGNSVTLAEATQMLKGLDVNGDEKVDFHEFVEGMGAFLLSLSLNPENDILYELHENPEKLTELFTSFGPDADGYLDVHSLHDQLRSITDLSEHDLLSLMAKLDKDSAGKINAVQFISGLADYKGVTHVPYAVLEKRLEEAEEEIARLKAENEELKAKLK